MLNKLKNVLFEQDEKAKPITTGGPPAPLTAQGAPVAPLGTALPQRDTKMYDAIRASTFSRSTAYTTLMDAADKLSAIIPDPIQRLKAAHVTSNSGRSAQQIADAVSMHLADIDAESLRFKQAIEEKRRQQIGALDAKASAAQLTITTSTQEVERLTARIQELQLNITKAQTEAAGVNSEKAIAESEIDNAINNFNIAANTLRDELNASKTTVLSTLS